ncbi:major facilitator superfamily domain-containing protein [Lipomyces starkeyi]
MFMSNIWDCFTLHPVQRHYVNKIDFFIFSYSLASFIVKALDQNNFSNAFVSGMQTDRNLFTTLFNMGYLTGSVPNQIIINQIIINRIRPSIWIPICEIMWGILTIATTIYSIRFVSGFFESATFPSFSLILGSWYTPSGLGKHISLFEFSSSAAGMFSGYIMAGLYATMNGTRDIPALRWMFIIDGVITIPIGIIGFFFLPDFPTSSRAMWLTPWEREFGIRRMAAIGRKPQQKLTLRRLRRLFLGPTLWASFIPYKQLNTIPTAGNALAVISAYVWPTISDKTHARWQFGVLSSAFGLLGSILLSIWNLPMGVLMFAQLIPNAGASG